MNDTIQLTLTIEQLRVIQDVIGYNYAEVEKYCGQYETDPEELSELLSNAG
jgi:hypothetical protein